MTCAKRHESAAKTAFYFFTFNPLYLCKKIADTVFLQKNKIADISVQIK